MNIGLVIIDENGNTHYDPEDVVRMWVRHDPEDASPVIQKTATYDTDEECYIIYRMNAIGMTSACRPTAGSSIRSPRQRPSTSSEPSQGR